MKNSKLAALNFQELLRYRGEPTDQASLPERNCTGYCVSCEEKGLLVNGDVKLDQMSHGADTDDFERVIRRLDPGGVDFPIAFLLESPGGYYVNGKQIDYKEARKQPPVFCYYWLPKGLTDWPTDPEEVKPSTYGPYFAYLIAKHKLHNAYFTNHIKCALARPDSKRFIRYQVVADPNNRDFKIRDNCYQQFLRKELEILKPRIVFYFGGNAKSMGYLSDLRSLFSDADNPFETLCHPAARSNQREILEENDEKIRQKLSQVTRA